VLREIRRLRIDRGEAAGPEIVRFMQERIVPNAQGGGARAACQIVEWANSAQIRTNRLAEPSRPAAIHPENPQMQQ